MTAAAVRPTATVPRPRTPGDDAAAPHRGPAGSAVAYQRVLHQLVRRELRLLAELAGWAEPGDAERRDALTGHAELIGTVLLHHHTVERDALWPALQRAVPAERAGDLRRALSAWTERCARIDHELRDLATAARQWRVAGRAPSRDAFATACRTLADAVDAQTADEERVLLPLLDAYLPPGDWAGIRRSARCPLSSADQLLVLGLALEDSCAGDRARLLEGLPRSVRWAWRYGGERRYRAAVVRLRGAPPAP